jgi:hypothetical protein
LTSFESVHPTYRLFELDADSLLPVKIHTYKLTDDGDWNLDHTWPEHLGLKDLSPKSFEQMAKNILKGDADLAMKFQNGKANGGGEKSIESCNLNCRVDMYCSIVNSVYADSRVC